MTTMDEVGRYIEQHCYLCDRAITASDVLVRNGGLQVVVSRRWGMRFRAHRRCWLARYGPEQPQEAQASMRLEEAA